MIRLHQDPEIKPHAFGEARNPSVFGDPTALRASTSSLKNPPAFSFDLAATAVRKPTTCLIQESLLL